MTNKRCLADDLNRARGWPGNEGGELAAACWQIRRDHMATVRRVIQRINYDDEADTARRSMSEPWREVWQDALQGGCRFGRQCWRHLADEDGDKFQLIADPVRNWITPHRPARAASAGPTDAAPAC